MKIQWIVVLIVVMAFLGGCVSQPQSRPTPAATKPVTVEKQRSAMAVQPAEEAQPAAVEPRSSGDKPTDAIETTQQAKVPTETAKAPVTAGSSSQEPKRRSGSAPPPEIKTETEAARINLVPHQPLKPTVKPKKEPIVRSSAESAGAASHPVWRSKAAVAKPAPVTKKPSVQKRVKTTKPTSGGQTAASPTPAARKAPSSSPADEKEAAKADLKAGKRADTDSDAPSRSETQLAMITRKPPAGTLDMDMSTWVFDEEHLPRTLPGGWVLDIRPDQLGNDRRCLLYSAKKPIFDGYDHSWIRLQITTDAIVVNTDSYLDASYPSQGLRIDNGELIPFMPDLLNKKTTYTKKPALAAMADGTTLTVSLGFWPTWPVTKTQNASIDLTGFKRAYAALKACSAAQ